MDEKEIQALIDRGVAPVKRRYIAPLIDEPVAPSEENGDNGSETKTETKTKAQETGSTGANADSAAPEEKRVKRKKKSRGMNKKRKHFMVQSGRECFSIISGGTCRMGERCKFSHDLKSFLDTRKPDIGERCYIYDIRGRCKFGFGCRYASSHSDFSGEVPTQLRKSPAADFQEMQEILTTELSITLRKHRYPFPRASAAADAVSRMLSSSASSTSESSSTSGGIPAAVPEDEKDEKDEKAQPGDEDQHTKKKLDFRGKVILAPLTTVGNLPFRRICKGFGVDVTVGEMALCKSLLQGNRTEWALLRRHPCEDIFGAQICGGQPQLVARTCELINNEAQVDFVDLNVGCPIDQVTNKGMGSFLMRKAKKLRSIAAHMTQVMDLPCTIKMRMGWTEKTSNALELMQSMQSLGVAAFAIHGRSRRQRYTKKANWSYIADAAKKVNIPVIGNGDIYTYLDYERHLAEGMECQMVARGALVKPWIFTEIKERKHYDISSSERFEILKNYVNYGLENWGSDTRGVERTRKFLLEWLSFLCRYIPVGLLERQDAHLNWRAPALVGRDDLETLMASSNSNDWVKLSEMLLGPVPDGFFFTPKHKANAYENEYTREAANRGREAANQGTRPVKRPKVEAAVEGGDSAQDVGMDTGTDMPTTAD